jgi:hypothetical protein
MSGGPSNRHTSTNHKRGYLPRQEGIRVAAYIHAHICAGFNSPVSLTLSDPHRDTGTHIRTGTYMDADIHIGTQAHMYIYTSVRKGAGRHRTGQEPYRTDGLAVGSTIYQCETMCMGPSLKRNLPDTLSLKKQQRNPKFGGPVEQSTPADAANVTHTRQAPIGVFGTYMKRWLMCKD